MARASCLPNPMLTAPDVASATGSRQNQGAHNPAIAAPPL